MLTCKKCGQELHEDQKVCIQCGTRTIRGDGFDYEQKSWIPLRGIKIGAGVVVFILLIIMVANALRVTPPGEIANEWFGAMAEGKLKLATRLVTPKFTSNLESRGMDLRALSAEYSGEVKGYNAQYKVGTTTNRSENAASVKVALVYPDGHLHQFNIVLIKDGRRWLVDAVE